MTPPTPPGPANPHWPLFGLRITTPRLELRYVDEALGVALADLAAHGVHDPTWMPFSIPWTQVPPPQLQVNTVQHYWRQRSAHQPNRWTLPFAVVERDGGVVVGCQDVGADDFAVTKAVGTGSWLGVAHQGRGIGKEMRAAVLHLAFAGLGAELAFTSAMEENHPSIGVTRSLGYVENGYTVRAGGADGRQRERELRYRLERAAWEQRRRDDIVIEGLEPCLPMLGLEA